MTDDSTFSPSDDPLSPNPNLEITKTAYRLFGCWEKQREENRIDEKMEEGSENSEQLLDNEGNDLENECEQVLENEGNDLDNDCEQVFEIEGNDHENVTDFDTRIVDGENGMSQGKNYLPPVVGMEFESYDDAYNYYNCYAKELGFAIRVKSSWTKRNSKEKRGAVLCCNCEGFKTIKEANSRRKETRTGCLAMIRLRLVESNRWRVDEVKLEHNHLFDPERAQNSKSHKKMDAGAKRKVEPTLDVEVRTIKLYRTPALDAMSYGNSSSNAQVIYNYFVGAANKSKFFYLMDLSDDGHLRNVFWIDSRSRAAYGYFGDVVAFDTVCLSNKYEIPLLAFVGVNHHGQPVLLGCGLLADETPETYIWLFRAWLTCMSGRPPQTIITDQCKALQSAIAEVFPRAHHRLCLSHVMQRILEKLGDLQENEPFRTALNRTVYDSVKLMKIFEKFQGEIEMMSSCISITQLHVNGPIVTYIVKEREGDVNMRKLETLKLCMIKQELRFDAFAVVLTSKVIYADMQCVYSTTMVWKKSHFNISCHDGGKISNVYTYQILAPTMLISRTQFSGLITCTDERYKLSRKV
ncbi:hypothetical protein AAG906_016379 [Vitis piasezkii]